MVAVRFGGAHRGEDPVPDRRQVGARRRRVTEAAGQAGAPVVVTPGNPVLLASFPDHARRRPRGALVVGHLLREKRSPPQGIQCMHGRLLS